MWHGTCKHNKIWNAAYIIKNKWLRYYKHDYYVSGIKVLSELKVNHNSVDRLACIVVHFHIQAASSTSYHRSTASWQLAKRSKSVKSIQAPSSQLQPAAEGIMKHWHWSIHSTPRNARDWTGQQRMHGCILCVPASLCHACNSAIAQERCMLTLRADSNELNIWLDTLIL